MANSSPWEDHTLNLSVQPHRFHTTASAVPDPALIHAFRDGDEAAFTRVYTGIYERLYWYARKFIPEEPEVEDMIAEAFLQVWKRREEFTSLESIHMFLHVAVRNQCLNLLKRRQMKHERHAEILAALEAQQAGDFYLEQLQAELLHLIAEQVNRLPPHLREIFLLSYQEGLKPADIATRLQLSVQTVKNRKVTALKVLRDALDHEPLIIALLVAMEWYDHFPSWST